MTIHISSEWVTGFLAGTAILLAILLVWHRIWGEARGVYMTTRKEAPDLPRLAPEDEMQIEFIPILGLIWTILAVLYSLAAFALGAWSCFTKEFSVPGNISPLAVGFLITAFCMTIINIAQSLATSILVLALRIPLSRPTVRVTTRQERIRWVSLLVGAIISVNFISLSLSGVFIYPMRWIGISILVIVICWVVRIWFRSLKKYKKEHTHSQ
ncbi:MAG TPA: hypothetical protein VMW91_03430 [Desulfosporosinus sp.]|nr:hypothetical protein [Desulfosporosinus sp.]